MASFVDQPIQYNNYIQTIDPQLYGNLGAIKQEQYDQGVERVQGYINTVAGLQVSRDVDKQYLDGRVGELTTRLNSLMNVDYGNRNIVSQAGGLAAQIASDPNVQNAVQGTAMVSKIRSDIEEARKNGKTWSPQNEWMAMRGVQEWYNNPNPGAEFRGGSYNPYIDVNDNINKRWKDAHPDSILRQSTNGDYYAYTMTESGYKMLPPDQVRAEIEATLDPAEINQLNINAAYNYKDYSLDNLRSEVGNVYGERENVYNNFIKKLEFDKLDSANNPEKLKELDLQISTAVEKLNSLNRNKKDTLSAIDTNPEAVKSYLYRNKWLDGIAGMIGYTEESQKIVENPIRKQAWDEYMDWNRFQLDQQKLAFENLNGGKSKKEKGGEDDGNLGELGLVAPSSKKDTTFSIDQFNQKAIDIHDQANSDLLELVWRKNPELFKDPQYVPNTDGKLKVKYVPKDKNTLVQITAKAKQWGEMYGEGSNDLDPMVKTWFDTHYNQLQIADRMKDISKKLEADADKYIRTQSEYSPKFDELENGKRTLTSARPFIAQTRNGAIEISRSDIKNYVSLISNERAAPAPTSGGVAGTPTGNYQPYSEDQYSKYNLTSEKYRALSQYSPQEFQEASRKLMSLSNEVRPAVNEKQRYINEQLRPYQFLQSNTEIQIPTNEPKLARSWAGIIERIRNQRTQDGSTLEGSTDWNTVNKMLTDKNVSGLQVFYVQPTAGGNPQLVISNPNVNSGKQERIELDIPTATDLKLYQNDPSSFARSMLTLNQGRTTGKIKYGQVGKYNVQYEVNPYLNSYIPTLYVSIPGQSSAQPVPITEGTFNSIDAVTNFLRNPQLEAYLDSKLGVRTATSNSTPSPFLQTNPFLQQAQSAGIFPNQ